MRLRTVYLIGAALGVVVGVLACVGFWVVVQAL